MHTCHNPLYCYLPPYILENLAQCDDSEIRDLALKALQLSAEARAIRATIGSMVTFAPMFSQGLSSETKERLIYDMEQRRFPLPGRLVRREGDPPVDDAAVNEAYDHAGITYDFYQQLFNRNSLDNRGMQLISSVHVGRQYNNAFWNGRQMAYGDGDGRIFIQFTKALDVVGHEMTHGVISHESNLEYQNESGALNESFADVMGALVQQWHKDEKDALNADWDIGELIMGSSPATRLRTFKDEKAYENDPFLGTDPQPKHLRDKYTGSDDNGGVHINSGIANHAFYLIALDIGGPAWEKPGQIWYQTLRNLNSQSNFQEAAQMTYEVAGTLFGSGSSEQQAVKKGWDAVGIII